MTEEQMIADGWRRCAVGQRTTQQCGLVEEARAQERARIRVRVQAAYDHVGQQPAPDSDPFYAGRIIALRQVLNILDMECEGMCGV